MSVQYTVVLEPDDGQFRVVVPALPEIITFGKDREDALGMARDAIELALFVRQEDGEEIPPSDIELAQVERVEVVFPAA